ncbi:hydantoinase/oxoprolinase family protein [Rhodospirillaceae bacterium SYSU D60014]|uniref:hydantoinase/oxoprolinase family protein n=1 Tax=Virgifigura deserti TaxID=2268457 RepID=UPI000E662032
MSDNLSTGWDLGGAHLKAAQVDSTGRLVAAVQVPCTLWLGIDHLIRAVEEARRSLSPTRRQGVTMTGELVDLFDSRAEGVRRLAAAVAEALPGTDLRLYAGEAGFVPLEGAADRAQEIASANWHASVQFVAACCREGLFVDVGSTTTDILPFADGAVRNAGYTDAERLITEELVYTGVTRTPVMALADSVPFAGERQRLMAEYFATTADIHRLTGALPEDADQLPTADGRGKSTEDSARRLARMLGRDLETADRTAWRRLARHLADRQHVMLQAAVDRILSRGIIADDAPVIGAGVGRFLLPELARRLARPYTDFADLLTGDSTVREWAARCAPATAVAALAAQGW